MSGRAILIVGGAFLLRAATESAALPRPAGIILGVAYAAAWIVVAELAGRRGQRLAAVFHAAVAAAIAYPIVWEATTRFDVLSASAASLLLIALSVALIVVAHRNGLQWPAWLAAAGATIDALLLSVSTKDVIPFLIALSVVGVVALMLSMTYVGWLLAIESDLFAIVLMVLTFANEPATNRPIVALIIFVLVWTVTASRAGAQVAAASLIGVAAVSAALLTPFATAVLWGVAAVVAAEIARRTGSLAFALQSVAWGILAATRGGLFTFAASMLVDHDAARDVPIAALVVTALCVVALLRLESFRLPLLAIATCGIVAAMLCSLRSAGNTAIVRTIVLAATAIALAAIGRRWRMREAAQLGAVLLVLTGIQIIAQELRAGAGAAFAALAVYGTAMLAMARLRRAPGAVAESPHG